MRTSFIVDKSGPISVCLWGEVAESMCGVWREHQERRQRGQSGPCYVDLCNLRIQGIAKNTWNGEVLTRMRTLTSIESVGGEGGTTVKGLPQPYAANMVTMSFSVPPSECCVSAFRSVRNKLRAPFRATLRGKVVDLQPIEMSHSGSVKRIFDLDDPAGFYITCCALRHNAESRALVNYQEVVLYYGTGRGPLGSSRGALYLMKDAMVIPVGRPSVLSASKIEQVVIQS